MSGKDTTPRSRRNRTCPDIQISRYSSAQSARLATEDPIVLPTIAHGKGKANAAPRTRDARDLTPINVSLPVQDRSRMPADLHDERGPARCRSLLRFLGGIEVVHLQDQCVRIDTGIIGLYTTNHRNQACHRCSACPCKERLQLPERTESEDGIQCTKETRRLSQEERFSG